MTRPIPNLPASFAGEHTDAEEAAMREFERDQESTALARRANRFQPRRRCSKPTTDYWTPCPLPPGHTGACQPPTA